MPVPARITDLSATASDNYPAGTDTVGPNLDDYLRGIQAVIRGDLASKGADIASATTTDLGAVKGLFHDITGTTTITGLGTVAAGVWKVLKFEGELTLTHNATSLILLGGENITTADGDVCMFVSEGSGNWRMVGYWPAAVNPAKVVSTDESQTLSNKTIAAATVTGAQTYTGTAIGSGSDRWIGTDGGTGMLINVPTGSSFTNAVNNAAVTVTSANLFAVTGALTASGSGHAFTNGAVSNALILDLGGTSIQFRNADTVGYNGGNAPCKVGTNSGTGRSINAGGTVNASGADGAEYHKKSPTCGTIAKGQIVGRDASGLLTDKWSECVGNFLIKSTNPGTVWGDAWGSPDALGIDPPAPPKYSNPDFSDLGIKELFADESDKSFDAQRKQCIEEMNKRIEEATLKYQSDCQEYDRKMQVFSPILEAARQTVDRMAKVGVVPCNVYIGAPGDYVIPIAGNNDGITATVTNAPTLAEYLRSVGRVTRILSDGRREVEVKPV